VLGTGPAGAATALALRHSGRSVVLIGRSDQITTRIGETLPPAVAPLLSRLGLWERFIADEHLASPGVSSAWGRPTLFENNFIFNPYGAGWHVDRIRFDAMLVREAARTGAIVHLGAQIRSCVNTASNGWKCEVDCGGKLHKIQSRLCIDATGRQSALACKHGAKRIVFDRLIGVIGFLSPKSQATSHDTSTLIESIEHGWWYSALLPDGHSVAAYMTDADLLARESSRGDSFWPKLLKDASHTLDRLQAFRFTSKPFVVCANSALLSQPSSHNWLAVGDAAFSFDPLSSQGISKALESGMRAADAINESWCGKASGFRDYTDWIRAQYYRYVRTHANYYSHEARWPDSLFWKRRQTS
jgi:flavin-dependent dehydrogenase